MRPDARHPNEWSNVYAPTVLERIPALLGSLDREVHSRTYGSFDREHWAWKFRDFPLGMLQSAVYPLALLWRYPLPDNRYYANDRLLEWIVAGMERTVSRQHSNGAFDAFAPNEQDPGPTLGVMHGIAEALRLVWDAMPANRRDPLLESIRAAADFALSRSETHAFVSNHWALFAVAFIDAAELLGDRRYRTRAEEIVHRIVREQSPDGWYREYDGPDPGYESLGIFHLAVYWTRTGSMDVKRSLSRSLEFYAHCILPDGSVAGHCGSRNTFLYFPGGLELLAGHEPLAAAIAAHMRDRIGLQNVLTPAVTDAENLASLAYSYLEACLTPAGSKGDEGLLPCQRLEDVRWFPDSQIAVIGRSPYYALINCLKGGVCRIFDRRTQQVAYEDAGYVLVGRGRRWASQRPGSGRLLPVEGGWELRCTAGFAEVEQTLLTPLRLLILRVLNLTLFRSRLIGRWLRRLIVRRLIRQGRPGPFHITRSWSFSDGVIRFVDRLVPNGRTRLDLVDLPRSFTPLHTGSAKYFHPSELEETPSVPVDGIRDALNRGEPAQLCFELQFPAGERPRLEWSSCHSRPPELPHSVCRPDVTSLPPSSPSR